LDQIDKAGRGILLMHDIQPATRRVLPTLLRELKMRNYHVVHVVPTPVDHAATSSNTNVN
jgi:peptidoglycan-N-acetylglucosamine deacetylase